MSTSRPMLKEYCLDNKYYLWYCSIIDNAIERNWTKKTTKEYFEKHHIIPRSVCPEKSKDQTNIVNLSAREHFICHLLLTKCMNSCKNTRKMTFALYRLIHGNDKLYIKNSVLYETIKKQHAKAASERSKITWSKHSTEERSAMLSGSNNPSYGKPCSEYRKKKVSEANTGNKYRLGILHTEESKMKMGDSKRGVSLGKWYFNTITNEECILKEKPLDQNWISGRKPGVVKPSSSVTGKTWYYNPNSNIEKYFAYGQEESGYIKGRKPRI